MNASNKQINYLAILFSDLGFDLKIKKAFLREEYNVEYTDELTSSQASGLISKLLEMKDN